MIKYCGFILCIMALPALAQERPPLSATMLDPNGGVVGGLLVIDSPAPYFKDPTWGKEYSPSVVIMPRLMDLPSGSLKLEVHNSGTCDGPQGPSTASLILSANDMGKVETPFVLPMTSLSGLSNHTITLHGGGDYKLLGCGSLINSEK